MDPWIMDPWIMDPWVHGSMDPWTHDGHAHHVLKTLVYLQQVTVQDDRGSELVEHEPSLAEELLHAQRGRGPLLAQRHRL